MGTTRGSGGHAGRLEHSGDPAPPRPDEVIGKDAPVELALLLGSLFLYRHAARDPLAGVPTC
jgi:hypothetical protein